MFHILFTDSPVYTIINEIENRQVVINDIKKNIDFLLKFPDSMECGSVTFLVEAVIYSCSEDGTCQRTCLVCPINLEISDSMSTPMCEMLAITLRV